MLGVERGIHVVEAPYDEFVPQTTVGAIATNQPAEVRQRPLDRHRVLFGLDHGDHGLLGCPEVLSQGLQSVVFVPSEERPCCQPLLAR